MENIKEQLTPAEKHYLAMKRAQAKYRKSNAERCCQWQKEYKERLKQDPEKWALFVEKQRENQKRFYEKKRAKRNAVVSESESD